LLVGADCASQRLVGSPHLSSPAAPFSSHHAWWKSQSVKPQTVDEPR
jgi:hypothetical protein